MPVNQYLRFFRKVLLCGQRARPNTGEWLLRYPSKGQEIVLSTLRSICGSKETRWTLNGKALELERQPGRSNQPVLPKTFSHHDQDAIRLTEHIFIRISQKRLYVGADHVL
jgi:hypothetical protein